VTGVQAWLAAAIIDWASSEIAVMVGIGDQQTADRRFAHAMDIALGHVSGLPDAETGVDACGGAR